MKQIRLWLVGLGLVAALALSGCASQSQAAQMTARPVAESGPAVLLASNRLAPNADDGGPGKGNQDDKGNNRNKGKGNNAKDTKGNPGLGNPAKGNADKKDGGQGNGNRGLGPWWQDFRSRLFGGVAGLKQGGWQLGRFKDAFPFAYPPGWAVSERGDAAVLSGPWQGNNYVFQMTRSVQVDARSLQDWLSSDLQRLRLTGSTVRYGQADNVQIAVVPGVRDPDYPCPVAYVYLWTANPAGKNERQALGVVSQESGSACNPTALNAFVDNYLAEVLRDQTGHAGKASPSQGGVTSPTAAFGTAVPTRAPAPGTPSAATGNWERTRFFNAFSFAYPKGWSMDRLGDTAHLQGEYEGRAYVADMVWMRDAPQVGLEQWARADLDDLGVNANDVNIDYAAEGGDTQIAMAGGVRMQGYQCPVVRVYVLANNAASGGQRSYVVTVAQANGQTCDPQALEDLAYEMVQQAE